MDYKFFKDYFDTLDCPEGICGGTKRNYIYALAELARHMGDRFRCEDGKICVPEFDDVVSYVSEWSAPPQQKARVYLGMKYWHKMHGEDNLDKQYTPVFTEEKMKQSKERAKQLSSDKEKTNWLDFKCVSRWAQNLRGRVFSWSDYRQEKLNKHQMRTLSLAFLFTYHLKYPVRNDLCTVQYGVEPSDEINYLDMNTHEIVFNHYKGSNKKKPVRQKLDRVMWRLFVRIRKQQSLRDKTKLADTKGYLIVNSHMNPIKKSCMSSWLNQACKQNGVTCEDCKGRRIGTSLLRKIVITNHHKGSPSLIKTKYFAETCCMHSTDQSQLYRRIDQES